MYTLVETDHLRTKSLAELRELKEEYSRKADKDDGYKHPLRFVEYLLNVLTSP